MEVDTIGKRLKQLREENNLSQLMLSKQIDISQSSIARYELDKTEPKASDIVKFAKYFDVSTDYLLCLEDL